MKWIDWIAAGSAALVLSGCYVPPARVHETLKISDRGDFSLQGVAIPKEQLPSALSSEKQRVNKLFTEVVVSPRANMDSVRYAVNTLESAHIRFAFIHREQMDSDHSGPSKGPSADL